MASYYLGIKPRNTKSKRRFSNNVPPGLHYLLPLDPKSEPFLDLFRSFLSSKDERATILALSEEDARLFIEIIDRALRVAKPEIELRKITFSILRRLCGRIGHLPESYLLPDKFDLSGMPHTFGGFADVWKGVFKGKDVAVKSLRVSVTDDKTGIRKRFCEEVAIWKNLSHPNVLDLIGVPDTLEDGKFSVVSEWMANGDIMGYVRVNAGNHLKLLAGAVEGLRYLHSADIVHGNLKGTNILITNTNPISACLMDFGFMTIVHDQSLSTESSKSEIGRGTTPFMAPELLFPSKFGLDKWIPTKEADIYAMATVIYQVLTGTTPFGKQTGIEVAIKVLGGVRPPKPTNALDLGLSDKVWTLLEDCWQIERERRPPVQEVLVYVKSSALGCGILSPVGGVVQRHEEPDSDSTMPDQLFPEMVTNSGAHSRYIPESSPSSSTDQNNIGPVKKKFDTGPSIGVDHIVSLLKDESGVKQLLDLERDEAQKYANILDASLGETTLNKQTRTKYLGCLRRLCGTIGIFPSSFVLADTFNGHGVIPFARGGYGTVSQASFQGRCVAVKTLVITHEAGGLQRLYKLLAREVVAWKWLQHENVLPFVGVTREFAIVSDFMENGNIMMFIAEHPLHNRLHLLMGAACGLEYLHSQNVVHGDLKGANVLIDSMRSARLADFGLTTIIDESTAGSTTGGRGPKGTTRWMAPEMLYPAHFEFLGDMERQLPSKSTDIYALGMTTLEVLTGKRPYNDIPNHFAVMLEVVGGRKPNRPPSGFSDNLWSLLLKVWDPEYGSQPPRRPSILSISDQMKEEAGGWDRSMIPPQPLQIGEETARVVPHT